MTEQFAPKASHGLSVLLPNTVTTFVCYQEIESFKAQNHFYQILLPCIRLFFLSDLLSLCRLSLVLVFASLPFFFTLAFVASSSFPHLGFCVFAFFYWEFFFFLVGDKQPTKRLCPSVSPSVGRSSVRPSVCL